jgi:hypothetical protein
MLLMVSIVGKDSLETKPNEEREAEEVRYVNENDQ